MIKSLQSFLLVALCISCVAVSAQKLPQADSVQNSYLNKRAKTFFFELFGPGSVYSLNYDTRFKNKQDGLGGRAGISFYADSETSFFTVPLVVNYLLGKRGKYFEVGAGVTLYTFKSDSYDGFFDNGGSDSYQLGDVSYYRSAKREYGLLGTFNFGYRYQPIDGGFSFRAGVSPVFSTHKVIPYWPYLSFGYAF
ncbi:hypothetical protein [Mucilaginibacter phyllosphaerae]|uniref:DUF3575 domain-containing protein n=1 Tax=Mucilaginibacter phyllosphaerae TaxID=1812349 RepID=A0A4Y8AKZ6_9SPHI|nr:hypothetical protein [Mucilaginibacter phyllosphaerae]MBB3967793.1 hypothetical protein [Mucilaginibacter phyllosphaerae]TEW69161.1 hypothetical protein E2R65_03055 [Mucilaginibacter phyllosphaerae]GGH03270.1 hypothetical protein GCM10007352_05900 [Mucilaginibacter phyllosphaerae]